MKRMTIAAKCFNSKADNTWRLQEMRQEDYLVKEEVTARFCVYQVNDN